MHLRKHDFTAALLAPFSFVIGFVVPFGVIGYGIPAILPGAGRTDAGLLLGPLAFIVAVPCAWLGPFLAFSLLSRSLIRDTLKRHSATLLFWLWLEWALRSPLVPWGADLP